MRCPKTILIFFAVMILGMSGCGNGDKDKTTSTAKSSGPEQQYIDDSARPLDPDRPSGPDTAAEAYTPTEAYTPAEAYTPTELDEQPKL